MSKNRALRVGIAIALVVVASAPQAYAKERVVVTRMTLRAAVANPSLFDTSAGQSTASHKFRPRRPPGRSCRENMLLGVGIGAGAGFAWRAIGLNRAPREVTASVTVIGGLIGLVAGSNTCR